MSDARLTTGALLRYLRGDASEKVLVQVLGIKTVESQTEIPAALTPIRRYRLMLSDGKSSFSACMLGTQMNRWIDTNVLKENSIIRLDRVTVNTIDKRNGRVMLMIYELDVLQSDCQRLGDPVSLTPADIIGIPAATTNVVRQTSQEQFVSLDALTPFLNKWTIKVRVTTKTPIRSYANARGPGKLFSCDLIDQSGEIRATAFNTECEKFHGALEIGQVYCIARASLKPANRQYNTLRNDYEMVFNHDTSIELRDPNEGQHIPQLECHFIPISEIAHRATNSTCDVIGVVRSVSDMQTVLGKTSQKEFHNRELVLIDETAAITTILWGQQAEEFDGSSNPVLALKGVKIGDYNGRTLSCLNSTWIRQDPSELARTAELRAWFDKDGRNIVLPDLSNGSEPSDRQTPWKTFGQIIAEGIGLGDRPEYICVKGICTLIRKDTAVYRTSNQFKWAYMLATEISDSTGSQWITMFQHEAELFLGVTAEQFGTYRLHQNERMIEQIFEKAMHRECLFKLRAKAEQYNDEQRIRLTCTNIRPIDWSILGRRWIDAIQQMEPASN